VQNRPSVDLDLTICADGDQLELEQRAVAVSHLIQ
jgi:hypothetical protein